MPGFLELAEEQPYGLWRGVKIMPLIEFEKPQEPMYLEDMDESQLRQYLAQLQLQLQELDSREPKNTASAEYEAWADDHEELEDAIDEVLEFLDELEGETPCYL